MKDAIHYCLHRVYIFLFLNNDRTFFEEKNILLLVFDSWMITIPEPKFYGGSGRAECSITDLGHGMAIFAHVSTLFVSVQ